MEVDKWKDDGERPMEIPNEEPIHFAVNSEMLKEVDGVEIPWYSVWFIMDEDVHTPLYQYNTGEGQTWFSNRRDFTEAEYHDPTEAFWYCVGQQFEHWNDAAIGEEFEEMEVYEKLFFNQLIDTFLEQRIPPEASVVIEYATEKYGSSEQ